MTKDMLSLAVLPSSPRSELPFRKTEEITIT